MMPHTMTITRRNKWMKRAVRHMAADDLASALRAMTASSRRRAVKVSLPKVTMMEKKP